ncbi:hypothetical protein JYT72_02325 [Crocinitomix catalasitica]|nr:hypothetical protein [Crocinitomix catalasitica]
MKSFVKISFTLLFLFPLFLCSQESNEDSLRKWFPQRLGKAEWKPMFGFDARRSWYSGNPIKINGYRIGMTFKGVHRFGLGYYYLKKKTLYDDFEVTESDIAEPVIVKFRINAIAFFYQRAIYKSPRWDVSIPLMFSYGEIRGLYLNDSGDFAEYFKDPYSAMNTGVDAKFFVLPWIAPRIHLGYRFTFNTTTAVKKAFDRFYFAYGVAVLPFELMKWIEKRKTEGRSIFDPRP